MLSTIGSKVSSCDFCGPRPPPLTRGDRQAGLRSDSQTVKDCLGILHFVTVRASPGDTRDREVKDEERGEKFEIRIFSI